MSSTGAICALTIKLQINEYCVRDLGQNGNGGTGPPPSFAAAPSFVATYDFLQKITQISFPNFRKVGKFEAFIEHRKAKSASASGGL